MQTCLCLFLPVLIYCFCNVPLVIIFSFCFVGYLLDWALLPTALVPEVVMITVLAEGVWMKQSISGVLENDSEPSSKIPYSYKLQWMTDGPALVVQVVACHTAVLETTWPNVSLDTWSAYNSSHACKWPGSWWAKEPRKGDHGMMKPCGECLFFSVTHTDSLSFTCTLVCAMSWIKERNFKERMTVCKNICIFA